MAKFRDFTIGLFFLIASLVLLNAGWNLRLLTQSLQQTSQNLQATSNGFKDYWEGQKKWLESDRNQKAIQAGIEAAAVFKASGQFINTQVLPQLKRQLIASTDATNTLNSLIWQVKSDTSKAFGVVNNGTLPELTANLSQLQKLQQDLGVSQKEISTALTHLINTGATTPEIINRRLNDPKLDQLLEGAIEIERGAVAVEGQLEGLAKNLNKATEPIAPMILTAQKWQPWMMRARLLGILADVFRPW